MQFVWILLIFSLTSVAYLKGSESGNTSSTPASDTYPPFSSSTSSFSVEPSSRHEALASTTISYREKRCYLYSCFCYKDNAKCRGYSHTLNFLPNVPANTRYFEMIEADLKNLTRPMLANLSNFLIEKMKLSSNRVVHIAPDAFTDFAHLEMLDLSGNPVVLADLRSSLRGISSKSMTSLVLKSMGLTFLPDNFFDPFSNMTFRRVRLDDNHLKTFNSALFAPFWFLRDVSLSNNQISRVNMSARICVVSLALRNNSLREFPDFCLHRSPDTGEEGDVSGFYNLQSLFIVNNPIRRIENLRGVCLPQLIKLDLSELLLERLKNNFISELPRLNQLLIRNMRVSKIRYEAFAFNSSSLRILKFMHCPRWNFETIKLWRMFRHCPKLEKLYVSNIKMDLRESEFYTLLRPLTSLKSLALLNIRLGFLPTNLLSRMPRLEELVFSGNNLNSNTLGHALANVTTLKYLNVRSNGITVVNEAILPWEVRRSLVMLDIAQNPFACTCDLRWFKSWVDDVRKNKSLQVRSYPGWYRCSTPPEMKRKMLSSFVLTEDDCAVKNPFILIGVVGVSLLVFVLGLFSIGYRYRWHWRFCLYRLRRRHRYAQVPGGVGHGGEEVPFFLYDAYLAHSTQDLDWIIEELLPVLEGEHGLKVFLDERDSVPGTVIADSITQHMDESARILLLISDSYNREGWRQCEFEHIMYAAVEQHKDVIAVLLGGVEAGRMTRDMRRMLTRGTFLQWGNSEEARKVFKSGLKLALKTQNADLQTLC